MRRRWRRCARVLELVDHVPERSMEVIGQRPCEQRLRYTLEGVPAGTIARIRACRRATGRIRLPAAIRNTLLRRAIIRDLDRLTWLVEAGAVPR